MSIVKHTDKRSGVTYVYESESYWDKEKKQPRSKRTLIGKIDEVTGEVIPTGKSGKKKSADSKVTQEQQTPSKPMADQVELLAQKDALISSLKEENRRLTKEKQAILEALNVLLQKWS